jgi:hypothetical protein
MLCLIEMGDVGRHPIDVLSYPNGGYRKTYQILDSYIAKGSEERSQSRFSARSGTISKQKAL